MKLIFRIAWRYFKSKKSIQAINIISWISVGAIVVATAAMIILFSVFNGLDQTIKKMYTTFNPEVKVTPQKGKFFSLSAGQKQQLASIPHIQYCSETIEDMALLSNGSEQRAAVVKGVDENWFQVSGIDSFMITGKAGWTGVSNTPPPAILGFGIANYLGINVENPFSELKIYYPKHNIFITLNPENALSVMTAKPEGAFRIQEEIDSKYILLPLQVAQHLFSRPGKISAVEIKADNPDNVLQVQQAAAAIMGKGFNVANRLEQNHTLYMVLSGEKWMVYAILLFVLLIASFNLTGSLYMLVLAKKQDISILKSMGLSNEKLRNIFLLEGIMLALTGALAGIVIGTLICLGQIYFGWVGLPQGFVISSYPVAFETQDFVLVVVTVLLIGLLAACYPAFKAQKQSVYLREE